MHTLKISLALDSKIRIEPVGVMPDEVWDGVVDWWSLGRKLDSKSKIIFVSIPDFSQRKIWLRENWKSLGYELTIDDEVKVALKSVDGLIAKFEELAVRDDADVASINLDVIKVNRPLTEFQKKNIRFLIGMPNGANFSVPGAGKTLTTLALWEFFRASAELDRMLIVCPRSAFEAWESDSSMLFRNPSISLFNDEPIDSLTEVLYVNYEQLEKTKHY